MLFHSKLSRRGNEIPRDSSFTYSSESLRMFSTFRFKEYGIDLMASDLTLTFSIVCCAPEYGYTGGQNDINQDFMIHSTYFVHFIKIII